MERDSIKNGAKRKRGQKPPFSHRKMYLLEAERILHDMKNGVLLLRALKEVG